MVWSWSYGMTSFTHHCQVNFVSGIIVYSWANAGFYPEGFKTKNISNSTRSGHSSPDIMLVELNFFLVLNPLWIKPCVRLWEHYNTCCKVHSAVMSYLVIPHSPYYRNHKRLKEWPKETELRIFEMSISQTIFEFVSKSEIRSRIFNLVSKEFKIPLFISLCTEY